MSVLASNSNSLNQFKPKRKKVRLFDLRAHNVDYLRYKVATHDWSKLLLCTDIQVVYDMFLCKVHKLINEHMPDMMITIGPRDPSYVAPLVKSLLIKRNRLRRRGRTVDADILANRINQIIQDTCSKQYTKLSEASSKQMWAAVKATNGSNVCHIHSILGIYSMISKKLTIFCFCLL